MNALGNIFLEPVRRSTAPAALVKEESDPVLLALAVNSLIKDGRALRQPDSRCNHE